METKTNYLLPSLEDISLCKLAQELFYHAMDEAVCDNNEKFYTQTMVFRDPCKFIKQKLILPSCLVPLLQKRIEFVNKEFVGWISHIFPVIVPGINYPQDVILFWPYIVWDTDGFINYEKTAVNLLTFPQLDRSKRYALMCVYSMEEDLKNFWSEESCEVLDYQIENIFMVQYWSCYKQNDLRIESPSSWNEYCIGILESLPRREFVAVKYFWNRLSLECQIQNIHLCLYPKVLTSWLKMLNETNLREIVVGKKLHRILIIYTNHRSYPKYIYWLWTLIKDIINEDGFVKLLEFIKRSVHKFVEDINLSTTLLITIWSSSSLELKHYAFQYNEGICIYNICGVMQCDMNESLERDDRIISIILSDASPKFRQTFWQNDCVKYIFNDKIRLK